MRDEQPMRVLVTGSTGYVGSRLVPELLEAGHEVLAASRSEGGTADYPWGSEVETREFDITDDELVRAAVHGVDAVVYLVHSMEDDDFVRKDREAAQRVAAACADAGVRHVVYLSGLVPDGELSDHLRSREEVEEVFLDGAVPATVLRASMVIGAGSTSYELLRRLSQRIPLLTPVPAWMRSRIQPVAVEDVVHAIARVLALTHDPIPADRHLDRHYDLGGDEVLSYPDLLAAFARVDGLRRYRFLVPWVPQRLVGWACARISGLPVSEVTSLVASLRHDMVCGEDDIRRDVLEDGYRFTTVAEALRRSLQDSGAPGTSRQGDVQSAAATDPT